MDLLSWSSGFGVGILAHTTITSGGSIHLGFAGTASENPHGEREHQQPQSQGTSLFHQLQAQSVEPCAHHADAFLAARAE